jgi:hypothetical protein
LKGLPGLLGETVVASDMHCHAAGEYSLPADKKMIKVDLG